MKVLIVSPHIDDAILSLGGTVKSLRQRNVDVYILFLFTKTAWTNNFAVSGKRYKEDAESVSLIRKNEEAKIQQQIGYDCEFLDLLDFPLRCDGNDVHSDEIKKKVTTLANPSDLIFFPLGMEHPDHIVTRDVGLDLLIEGYNILLYEDLPYVCTPDFQYANLWKTMRDNRFSAFLTPIEIDDKISVLLLYGSQVSLDWLINIKNYSYSLIDNNFYERFWIPQGVSSEVESILALLQS